MDARSSQPQRPIRCFDIFAEYNQIKEPDKGKSALLLWPVRHMAFGLLSDHMAQWRRGWNHQRSD
jgi:hypothetical protein